MDQIQIHFYVILSKLVDPIFVNLQLFKKSKSIELWNDCKRSIGRISVVTGKFG
jgi:hypothetical protein